MGQTTGQLDRDTDVRFLKGVGPRRAEQFAGLHVNTAGDLLEYYPRHHEFPPPPAAINELIVDHSAMITGRVVDMRLHRHSRPVRLVMTVEDDTGHCQLIWFHGGYLQDKFLPGDRISAWGKVSQYKEILQLVNPRWIKVDDQNQPLLQDHPAQSVYPAGGELSSAKIARIIHDSLEPMLTFIRERYTEAFQNARKLPTRKDALRWIHQPKHSEQIADARRRLAYDELFLMQLGINLRREHIRRAQPAYPLTSTERIDQRIRKLFPFQLTDDQNKVIKEICSDLARNEPMNRLLQGDVGSGKTVVALYAALVAVSSRFQVAIMAPTEILAEQHFNSLEQYLEHSRVRRLLLTGGLTGPKRRQCLEQIQQNEIDIVVGTQALLQQDVTFHKLALVVIDEQHKFGVRQRELIRSKDIAPHYLVMTATPIPRTLAMTFFGDLDISTIEHLPPGRTEIITRWVRDDQMNEACDFIRKKLNQNHQAYFVYPRIEQDQTETDDAVLLKGAIAECERLQKDVFPEHKVALLHGRMDRDQKQKIMSEFRSGHIHVLVTTVVIEVGVDVPNATIMVIEHAERFGLAQLHQLRGRIGRGQKQSYCLLFGNPGNDQARQRLEIMTKTSDGFRIAEEDLRLRGPGEFFGTAQHGLPALKIANIIEDMDLLRMAQKDAVEMVRNDPELTLPEHRQLRSELIRQFGDDLNLVDVG